MKRRTFMALFGTMATSTGLALSSGAFSSVEAKRTVTISTAADDEALLKMEPLTDHGLDGESTLRSVSGGTEVLFQIPGSGLGESNAEGIGVDSIYEFHDLLRIENQGTQPVEIYSIYDGDAFAEAALIRGASTLESDPPVLTVGESVEVGLLLDTHGTSIDTHDETLTIVADQPDE